MGSHYSRPEERTSIGQINTSNHIILNNEPCVLKVLCVIYSVSKAQLAAVSAEQGFNTLWCLFVKTAGAGKELQ